MRCGKISPVLGCVVRLGQEATSGMKEEETAGASSLIPSLLFLRHLGIPIDVWSIPLAL